MLSPKAEARITGHTIEQVQAAQEARSITLAWLDQQITALGLDPRNYTGPLLGTPEWSALPQDAPERLAALLIAGRVWVQREADRAEDVAYEAALHVEHGVIEALDSVEPANAMARQLAGGLARTPTYAERTQRMQQCPPIHEVQATADWTPVQIPGRPGWWRHFIDGQQVDLPTASVSEAAA
jgi:hypothetical protein